MIICLEQYHVRPKQSLSLVGSIDDYLVGAVSCAIEAISSFIEALLIQKATGYQ
jgi:hypothetical protein